MSIDPISDGEGGASIRAKINEAISEANSIDAAIAGKADVSHTHTVPFYWLDFLNYDPTLSSNSSEEVPVVSAVKGYADGKLSKAGGTMTGPITLAGDAASALQPVTKQQLEAALVNMGKRTRVRVKTTGEVNLGGGLAAGASVDGVTVALGDLVLVASQSTTSQNGVYVVPTSGSAARAAEFDTWDEHPGSLTTVAEGSTQADTVWLCTSNAGGTLGSTAIAFSQLRVSGELLAANNLSDLANAATARSNLGVVIGTHVQAYNANLAAFAGLSLVADRLPYANGTGTLALATFTAFGRSLVDDADGAAACTTLGAAQLSGATFTGAVQAYQNADFPLKVRKNGDLYGVDIGVNVGDGVVKGGFNNYLIIRGLGNSVGEGIIFQRDPGDAGSPTELFRAAPGALNVSGVVHPVSDNVYSVGTASLKWSVIYSNTGTINTSDAREKDWRGGLTPAEVAAAQRILSRIGAYRWLSAVAEKGDAARLHIGVLAQDVAADMEAEGLGAADYGFWCSDVQMTSAQRVETYDVLEQVTEAIAVRQIEVREGVPTLIETTEQRAVVDMVAVVDVAGAPVLGADGEQLTYPVPRTRTVTREKTVTVEVPLLDESGEPVVRYGIRYDELAMFLFGACSSR